MMMMMMMVEEGGIGGKYGVVKGTGYIELCESKRQSNLWCME
jgi:hypothetical protein